jgi:hypothetical protein
VAAIRVAAAAGDRAAALAAAGELRRMVTELRATDDLSAKQAAAILTAAAQVETRLALLAQPASETPTSVTTGTPPSTGKGKRKGKRGDEGGD